MAASLLLQLPYMGGGGPVAPRAPPLPSLRRAARPPASPWARPLPLLRRALEGSIVRASRFPASPAGPPPPGGRARDVALSARIDRRGRLIKTTLGGGEEWEKEPWGQDWGTKPGERVREEEPPARDSDEEFDAMARQLAAFHRKHGKTRASRTWSENPRLGRWVQRQRVLAKRGLLSGKQLRRLGKAGFVWSITDKPSWSRRFAELAAYKERYGDCMVPKKGFVWSLRVEWEARCQQLVAYKEATGDCNVPQGWAENPQLAAWVKLQRQIYRRGKLEEDRKEILEEMHGEKGFVWGVREGGAGIPWTVRFNELKEYYEAHGDCLVPHQYSENPGLGNWVSSQRQLHRRGKLLKHRREKLEAIGFLFRVRARRAPSRGVKLGRQAGIEWDERYKDLVAYKEEHGDCLVPSKWPDNPQLSVWVIAQRYRRKHARMEASRVARLEAVGFVWDVYGAEWEGMFEEMMAFKSRFGNCATPLQWSESPRLGRWVARQRFERRNGALSPARQARLEAEGFSWEVPSEDWEARFSELVSYKLEFGDCNVPSRWAPNTKLGEWVARQRQRRKGAGSPLESEQEARLEALGFVWDVKEGEWEARFSELLDYKRAHGDCLVPPRWRSNPQLGRWVDTQRSRKKRGDLQVEKSSEAAISLGFRPEEHREAALEREGFVWEVRVRMSWEDRYQELLGYKERYGDCRVPKGWTESPQLAMWVLNQRVRKKTIPPERIARLDAIGFTWNVNEEDRERKRREAAMQAAKK